MNGPKCTMSWNENDDGADSMLSMPRTKSSCAATASAAMHTSRTSRRIRWAVSTSCDEPPISEWPEMRIVNGSNSA